MYIVYCTLIYISNLYLKVSGRIAYKRQETAPSIPFPGKSYGYEEDEETGRLKPQQFPSHDTSLGPAFYNVALVRRERKRGRGRRTVHVHVHVHQ